MGLPVAIPTVRRAWSTRVPRQAAAKLDDAEHLQAMRLLNVRDDDGLAVLGLGTVDFLGPGWQKNPQTTQGIGFATVEELHYSAGGGVTGGLSDSTLESYPGAVIVGDYRVAVDHVASNWRRRDMRGRSAGYDVWTVSIPIVAPGVTTTAPFRLPVPDTGARCVGLAVSGDAMPGAIGADVWVTNEDAAGAALGDICALTVFNDANAPSGAMDIYPTPYPSARIEPGKLAFTYCVDAGSPLTVLHFAIKVRR